jgi:hypothetical protein
MARLIRAAGLRWPIEEDFEFGKVSHESRELPGLAPSKINGSNFLFLYQGQPGLPVDPQ